MTDSGAKLVRFGECELDLATRELRRAGELVALEPRVFALLAYLIAQRHRAIDKDEIQDAVWSGMIVSETALTRAIMKARRAVGDSAELQAVIRTLHGHGYQFVAALTDSTTSHRDIGEPSGFRPARRRLFAALAAITVVALVVFLRPAERPQDILRLAIMPVDNQTNDVELEWTRLGLMGFANDFALRGAELAVLPASDVIRYTEINGLPDDDSAAGSLEELRRIYGVSHMLSSRLEKNANVLRLTYELYKPDDEVDRGTMVGAEPTRLMRGMIRAIGDALGGSSHAREINVISEDPFINEAYSRGLGLALEGRCADALQLFEVVKSSVERIGRAHYEWASCARILGRWQEAEAEFKRILEQTPEEPSSSLRALAFHGLGTVYIRTGRADDAREILALGLREARQVGDPKLGGMILNNLAIEAKNRREFSEARELLARATVAHNEAGSGILPGQLPAALANIDMAEGKLAQADEHLQQALEAFRATGDRRNEAMMLNNLGYLRRLQARMDEAEPLHLESLAIRRELGDRVGQGRILGMLSILYEEAGRFEDAKNAADEAYRIASAANDRLFMATALAQRGQAELGEGDIEGARYSFSQSKAIFEEIGDTSRAAQTTIRLARIQFQSGDNAEAQENAAAVLTVSRREALHEPSIEALELNGDIARQQADLAAAAAAYQDALDYIDRTGFVERKTDIVIKLATLLLEEDDLASSEPLVGYLIEQGDTADGLRIRARYASQSGDVERSIALMESIQSLAAGDWTETDQATLLKYREALRE